MYTSILQHFTEQDIRNLLVNKSSTPKVMKSMSHHEFLSLVDSGQERAAGDLNNGQNGETDDTRIGLRSRLFDDEPVLPGSIVTRANAPATYKIESKSAKELAEDQQRSTVTEEHPTVVLTTPAHDRIPEEDEELEEGEPEITSGEANNSLYLSFNEEQEYSESSKRQSDDVKLVEAANETETESDFLKCDETKVLDEIPESDADQTERDDTVVDGNCGDNWGEEEKKEEPKLSLPPSAHSNTGSQPKNFPSHSPNVSYQSHHHQNQHHHQQQQQRSSLNSLMRKAANNKIFVSNLDPKVRHTILYLSLHFQILYKHLPFLICFRFKTEICMNCSPNSPTLPLLVSFLTRQPKNQKSKTF